MKISTYLKQSSPVSGSQRQQLAKIQESLADTGTLIAKELARDWGKNHSTESKESLDKSGEFKRSCAQFLALQYAGFIGNMMQQLRKLLRFVSIGFFLGIVSVMVYPFRSQDAFVWAGTVNFVLLGLPVIYMVAQIERHPLLAASAEQQDRWRFGSTLGKITLNFALPLAGLVASHFPAFGRSLIVLLQPALKAMQ